MGVVVPFKKNSSPYCSCEQVELEQQRRTLRYLLDTAHLTGVDRHALETMLTAVEAALVRANASDKQH